MTAQGIGAAVPRKEDRRFITGRGRYVGDLVGPSVLRACFLRSSHAHADFTITDISDAASLPGVVAVLTGADMKADNLGSLPLQWDFENTDGSRLWKPAMFALATDTVRFVGQPIAVVLAETDAIARDAAELIAVDFEEKPAAARLEDAMAPGAPAVWPERPDNTSLRWTNGEKAATDAAFENAAHVVALDLVNHRIAPMSVEPRVSMARYDLGRDHLTLVSSCQLVHEVQRMLAKDIFRVPETRMDVIAPDIGGGFGMKSYIYPEDVAVLWAARRLNRDVAWIGDRTEAFLSDSGARDHVTHAELALDADHNFLGLRVSITANMGAYLSQHAAAVPTIYCTFVLPGPYRIDASFVDVRSVFSNSAPLDAYRGAGRSEAVYVTERLVDQAARELGVDPSELRRRNLVTEPELPYVTSLGSRLDSGDAPALLARALDRTDHASLEARRAAARQNGKLLGHGLAMYAANCGGCSSEDARSVGSQVGSWESARLQVHPSGAATLYVGTHNHGQGHETAFAQLVSEKTGLELDAIDVVFGDTSRIQRGMGTFASRSAVICGPAIGLATDRVIEKAKKIAAHMLEASVADIELKDNAFNIAGTDRNVPFAKVAQAAHTFGGFGEDGREPGLDETGFYDPEDFTYPFGAHIAEVEIDEVTGRTELTRYVAVDDIGVEINPLIVEGQVQGGAVQGIGQALMEAILYDEDSGQLVTGSFMDYEMPRAHTLCAIESERIASRCTTNPLGAKGAGEAGTFAAPAAVTNAVLDALSQAGVTAFDMPATPLRVWRALRSAASA
tara:strand:+ start:3440 stop:5812 length:2373 start_codon:yes stop_codon:yes gene_type:complete